MKFSSNYTTNKVYLSRLKVYNVVLSQHKFRICLTTPVHLVYNMTMIIEGGQMSHNTYYTLYTQEMILNADEKNTYSWSDESNSTSIIISQRP